MPQVAAYITGHGFGHATRMAAVLAALARRVPGLRVSLISPAPEWLFRSNLGLPFEYRPQALDVGVIQQDSLHLDAGATLEAYAQFLDGQATILAREEAALRRSRPDLLLADIPPAAFTLAARLGVPGVGISNFTWDWIYADYVRRFPDYAPIVDAIRHAYAQADLLLRLPFHGPCDAFKSVRDIPMIARRAERPRDEIRRTLGLDGSRPMILLSFGGFELGGVDFRRVGELREYRFVVTQAPPQPPDNIRVVRNGSLPYVELVAAADAVITKPGYGIVSDCLANRTPVLYTSRGEFAEYAPLVAGLERYGVAAFIDNRDLLAGNWRDGLGALLSREPHWPELPARGAEAAAQILGEYLD